MKVSEEHKKQIEFIDHCRANYPDLLVFRIPNDAKRSKVNGYLSKRLGTVPGIPDTFIPIFRLFIEFKSLKGTLSKNQKKAVQRLRNAGYQVEVCDSTEDAIALVENKIKTLDSMNSFLQLLPIEQDTNILDTIPVVGEISHNIFIKIYIGDNSKGILGESSIIEVDPVKFPSQFKEFSSWQIVGDTQQATRIVKGGEECGISK